MAALIWLTNFLGDSENEREKERPDGLRLPHMGMRTHFTFQSLFFGI